MSAASTILGKAAVGRGGVTAIVTRKISRRGAHAHHGGHGAVVVSRQLSSRLTLALRGVGSGAHRSSLRCVGDNNNANNVEEKEASSRGESGGSDDALEREREVRRSVDELLDTPFFANNIEPFNRYTRDSPKLLPFSTVPDLWRNLAR
jgi:hypothetical protein